MNNLESAIKAINQNIPEPPDLHPLNNNNLLQAAKMNIMNMIKLERKNQHITQRELAARSGMSQGTITRAERHGYISINSLIRIVSGLGKKFIIQ